MIRVTRILEYIYTDRESFEEDQARWFLGVSRVSRPNNRVTIRSAMLPPETIMEGGPPRFGKPSQQQVEEALDQSSIDPAEFAALLALFGYRL